MYLTHTFNGDAGPVEWLDKVSESFQQAGWDIVFHGKKNVTSVDSRFNSNAYSLTIADRSYFSGKMIINFTEPKPLTITLLPEGQNNVTTYNGDKSLSYGINKITENVNSIEVNNNTQLDVRDSSGNPALICVDYLVVRTTVRTGLSLYIAFFTNPIDENISIRVYREFDIYKSFYVQNSVATTYLGIPLSTRIEKLWMHANKDAMFMLTKHATHYAPAFIGLLNTFDADSYNYPLYVAVPISNDTVKYYDNSYNNSFLRAGGSNLYQHSFFVGSDGNRTQYGNNITGTYCTTDTNHLLINNVYGNEVVARNIQVTISTKLLGFFPFIKKVFYKNPISGDTVTIDGRSYLVFPDTYRTDPTSYFVMEAQ